MRLNADWQSATRVIDRIGTADSLRFGTRTRIGLNVFANLGQRPEIVRKHPFLRGSRVTLGIENLLDSRVGVTDALGATPVNYQPGYIDPVGRSIRLNFRKLF